MIKFLLLGSLMTFAITVVLALIDDYFEKRKVKKSKQKEREFNDAKILHEFGFDNEYKELIDKYKELTEKSEELDIDNYDKCTYIAYSASEYYRNAREDLLLKIKEVIKKRIVAEMSELGLNADKEFYYLNSILCSKKEYENANGRGGQDV